jgi:hypothetical protein
MNAYSSDEERGVSPARGRRFVCLAGIAIALFFTGCASDTWSTKSPEDGTDYPGWTKAASLPFSFLGHQQSF